MAASSSSSSSSLLLPDIKFISRQSTIGRRVSLSGIFMSRNRLICRNLPLFTRIRASKEDNVVVEDGENAMIKQVNGSLGLNGNGTASSKRVNGDYQFGSSIETYTNGKLNGNDSLGKYVNGNVIAVPEVEPDEVSESRKQVVRKKMIEDIGKEDVWFKKNQQE